MDAVAAGFKPRAMVWADFRPVPSAPHFIPRPIPSPPATGLPIPWPIGHEPEELARKVRAAPEHRAVYEAVWEWVRGEWRDAERLGSPLD